MKLIRSIHSPDLPRHGCALTIGNFDAVHLGHRKILRYLVAQSRARGLPAVVMTFDPHPQEYFARAAAAATESPARLTTTAARYFALRDCGVDVMLSLKFNRDLAQTSAEDFVSDVLVRDLRVKYLLVGDDFRFGKRRAGDAALLADKAAAGGYELSRFDSITRGDQRISSTRIRAALAGGDLRQAADLLGRNYAHCGRIIHGDKRGRDWGFPTINLALRHSPALAGIFAVRVAGLGETSLDGVASLGTRPTLNPASQKRLLEVHLFDFHRDVYGARVCVEFIAKIRDEKKFADYDALRKCMAEDARAARKILGHRDE